MKYDFEKIRENVCNIVKEFEQVMNYLRESNAADNMREHELSKSTFKLISYFDSESEFNDLFTNKMLFCGTFATTLSNYEVSKQIIENTINNGIDNTIEKLNSFFNYSKTKFSLYYTLLGIRINKEYVIDEKFKLINHKENDLIDSTISNGLTPENFKSHILKEKFKTEAVLVFTDNLILDTGDSSNFHVYSENLVKKLSQIILLINLSTKKGCTLLSSYYDFEIDSIISAPASLGFSLCKFVPQDNYDVEIDIEDFKQSMDLIEKFNSNYLEHLNFILSKFSDACLRNDYLGTAVELRTVLESIYSSDKDQHEPISHTVSYRAACFLGNNSTEKLEIYKFLKNVYSIASSIIHGTYKPKDDHPEKIERFKIICSESIVKFIKIGQFYDREMWDKLMFEMSSDK